MAIKIKKLNYILHNKYILKNISLNINEGEILIIMGPNGSGKSSLIKFLAGDFPVNNGIIMYDRKDLKEINLYEQAKIRSVMSQSQEIVYDYSVKEIIEMGWLNIKTNNNITLKESLKNVCYECGVNNILNRKYNSLSGGEQRSVNFARTLIQLSFNGNDSNRYFILDEPTANLDIAHKIAMMNTLCKKKHEGFGIIIVLHDLNLAYKFADKIGLMKKGQLKYIGKTEEIFTNKILTSIYETDVIVNKSNKTIKYY